MKAASGHRKQTRTNRRGAPKTARTHGRRGLHDLLDAYQGLSGFNVNTLGLQEYVTTYGEITDTGIQILSEKFRARFPPTQATRTFYDLGCGIGRAVLGMAILNPDIQAVGVEIVQDRVRQAQLALERLRPRAPRAVNRVRIVQGSFTDPATRLSDACWVFISNLCLGDAIQKSLADKLVTELPVGAVVICSRELPLGEGSRLKLLERSFTVPMTWSATSTCSMYQKV